MYSLKMSDISVVNKPLISVIVPVYNCEQYLDRCLQSLAVQTWPNLEIILVNNGSTDGSEAILRRYVEMDSRFALYSQENKGINGSRNRGLMESHGELVGFVDADDYVQPRMYETLAVNLLNSSSDVAICDYTMIYSSWEQHHTLALNNEVADADVISIATLYLRYFGRNPVVWNKLYRASVIRKNRLSFEVGHGEDLLFHLRLIPHLQRVCTVSDDLYCYVQRRSSAAHSLMQISEKDMTLLSRYLEKQEKHNEMQQLSFLAFSNIFTGFMFSSYCIGKSVAYFEEQIRSFRTWLLFDRFCREISQTDHLIALCHEGVMSKRFYVIQKMIFGLCAYRHDRLAARLAWFFSKLIVLKKRKFLTGQFE